MTLWSEARAARRTDLMTAVLLAALSLVLVFVAAACWLWGLLQLQQVFGDYRLRHPRPCRQRQKGDPARQTVSHALAAHHRLLK